MHVFSINRLHGWNGRLNSFKQFLASKKGESWSASEFQHSAGVPHGRVEEAVFYSKAALVLTLF